MVIEPTYHMPGTLLGTKNPCPSRSYHLGRTRRVTVQWYVVWGGAVEAARGDLSQLWRSGKAFWAKCYPRWNMNNVSGQTAMYEGHRGERAQHMTGNERNPAWEGEVRRRKAQIKQRLGHVKDSDSVQQVRGIHPFKGFEQEADMMRCEF